MDVSFWVTFCTVVHSIQYNQSLVALFTQGGVGVVGLEAREGLQQGGLLIFLHRHRLAMFACHFCGICTSFDYGQLAPRMFGCLANQRSCVHVMATAFPLWVCSLYLKEGGSPVWQGKLAIFRL